MDLVSNMKLHNFMSNFFILLIHIYQRIAPERVRRACRFSPTCSEYAVLAIMKYGAWRGGWLAIKRLSRCKPPHGGFDPVI